MLEHIKFLFALIAVTLTFSAAAQADASKWMSELRGAVDSAEVFLIERDRTFRYAFAENDVTRAGCRYAVSSPEDLDSLIEVLNGAKLVQITPDKSEVDGRIVVRFSKGDARLSTLLMGPDYSNAKARGTYRRDGSSIAVEAANGIEADMRLWAAQHKQLATSKNCH